MANRAYNMLVVVCCVWCLTAIAVRDRLYEIGMEYQIPTYIHSLAKAFMILYGIRVAEHAVVDRVFQLRFTLLLTSLFACLLLDRIVLIPCHLRGRYQIIHCVGNIAVAIVAWTDAADAFVHPSSALQGDSDLSPYIIALAIHTYHVIAFRPLTPADWKHHLLMIFGTLPIVAWVPSGRLTSLACFAACGAPGAISYAAIALRKNEVLSRLEEKRINAGVNTWFRAPLVTVSAYVVFVAVWDRYSHTPDATTAIAGTCLSILIFWNGQFYGRQVVENYGSCIMQCRADRRVPAPTVC